MATSPDDNRLGRAYAAPEVTVFYDRSRCRHYAECVRGLPQVFDPTRRPWIRADLADADTVAEVVRRCPTGALHYRLLAEKPEEPPHPTIITPDPRGPLLVRGDLVLDTPRARWLRPAPRCALAAAPGTSPSVTAHAVSTAAPLAAPETRRRHPRSVEPETWRLCISWTSRTARTARAASGSSGVKARAPAKSHLADSSGYIFILLATSSQPKAAFLQVMSPFSSSTPT